MNIYMYAVHVAPIKTINRCPRRPANLIVKCKQLLQLLWLAVTQTLDLTATASRHYHSSCCSGWQLHRLSISQPLQAVTITAAAAMAVTVTAPTVHAAVRVTAAALNMTVTTAAAQGGDTVVRAATALIGKS